MVELNKIIQALLGDLSSSKQDQSEILEKWFSAIFDGAKDAIFISSERGRFVLCNRGAEKLTGYSSAELSAMSITDLHRPEDQEAYNQFFDRIMAGEEITSQARILRKDGSRILVEFNNKAFEIDGSRFMHTIARDISERERTIRALEKTRAKYESFLNNISEGIYLQMMKEPIDISLPVEDQIDALYENAYIGECNDALARMYGLDSSRELVGKKLVDFHEGPNHPVNREEMRRFIKNGYREASEPSLELCYDGRKRWFMNTTTGVIENGKLLYLWGTQHDITASRRAEEQVIRLSEAVEQLDEIVCVVEPDGTVSYINPAFEKITGYPADEVLGQKKLLLRGGKQSGKLYSELWAAVNAGKSWSGNLVNQKKDGTVFTAHTSVSPVKHKDGSITGFIWIVRDITAELTLQERSEEARKLEAVGTLAGGIAHDFNNLLTAILGFTELALRDEKKGSEQFKRLQAVYTAGLKAKDLVKQILTFARKSDEVVKPIRPDKIIAKALDLLQAGKPSNIEIESAISSRAEIRGAPTHVQQIIEHLSSNAFHAIGKEEGKVSISLREVNLESSFTDQHFGLTPGDYLELKVADTGKGIPPEHMEQLFDPYFTTKGQGEGSGMGLSTVHGIVKKYGGEILVESSPDKGSIFTIYLPVCS